MLKSELAKILRNYLVEQCTLTESAAEFIPDQELIESYLLCYPCGAVMAGGSSLEQMIVEATDETDFLKRVRDIHREEAHNFDVEWDDEVAEFVEDNDWETDVVGHDLGSQLSRESPDEHSCGKFTIEETETGELQVPFLWFPSLPGRIRPLLLFPSEKMFMEHMGEEEENE